MDVLMDKIEACFLAAPRFIQKTIVFGLFLGTVGSTIYAVQDFREQRRIRAISLEEKVRVLSASLSGSVQAITDIQREIRARQELVATLQKDAATASKLIDLNREQVEAIADVMRSEQERSFWGNQVLAVFYVLLGVGAAELYRALVRRWRKKRLMQSAPASA
jgi:hypothetical protein